MGYQPSQVMNIQAWASRELGLPDVLTALSFDNAVMTFGIWAENKLHEVDSEGKPLHTLREILAPPPTEQQRREQNRAQLKLLEFASRRRGSRIKMD